MKKSIIIFLSLFLFSFVFVFASTGVECLDANVWNICKHHSVDMGFGYERVPLSCDSPYWTDGVCWSREDVSSFGCYDGSQAIPFNSYICLSTTKSAYACQSGGYACQSGYDYVSNIPIYSFYCDLGDPKYSGFVQCLMGCDPLTGLCREGFRECNEGYEICENNQRLKCVDNSWQVLESCNNKICSEVNYDKSVCMEYYCYNTLTNRCEPSSVRGHNCYNLYNECVYNHVSNSVPIMPFILLLLGIGLLFLFRGKLSFFSVLFRNPFVIVLLIVFIFIFMKIRGWI